MLPSDILDLKKAFQKVIHDKLDAARPDRAGFETMHTRDEMLAALHVRPNALRHTSRPATEYRHTEDEIQATTRLQVHSS